MFKKCSRLINKLMLKCLQGLTKKKIFFSIPPPKFNNKYIHLY